MMMRLKETPQEEKVAIQITHPLVISLKCKIQVMANHLLNFLGDIILAAELNHILNSIRNNQHISVTDSICCLD